LRADYIKNSGDQGGRTWPRESWTRKHLWPFSSIHYPPGVFCSQWELGALPTNFLWPQSMLKLESKASGIGGALRKSHRHYQGLVMDLHCHSKGGMNTWAPSNVS